MLVATFFFALMNIFIKAVSHLPVMELVFFRCGVSLIICLIEMQRAGVDWRGTNRRLLFLRGAIGTASLYLYFITIAHMPLGIAVVIQYLSPIFTTILGIFILKEHVKPISWLFFMVSFTGVFLIKGLDGNVEMLYLLIGIASAIGSAFAYITIRTLKENEHPLVVVFHFQLVGTITGMAFSAPVFEIPHGMEWLYLFLIGLFTQLGQVNLTKALQQEKVAKVSIINYTGIIYAVLAGFLLFNETYGTGTLFGILMVIGGVLLSMLFH